jgi:TIR domain-containing protein/uncharacterized protein DUF1566
MPALFFSYSRDDAEFVLRLADDLRAAGVDLWLDQQDIAPGERWDRAVEEALKSSGCLLVVLSPVSAASQNVLDEISYALDHGKRIVPVLYKDCDVPFRLRRLQYIDFRSSYDKSLAQLVKTIDRGPAAPTTSRAADPLAPNRSGTGYKRYAYGIGGAIAILAIIAALIFSKRGNGPPIPLEDRPAAAASPTAQSVGFQTAAKKEEAATTTAVAKSARHYTVNPCGSIRDSQTGLEWLVGPDRNMTWDEAAAWTASRTECGGGWGMPTIRQLATLNDPKSTAGTGFFDRGRNWPAHIGPAFAAIGGGSWVWSSEQSGPRSARSFNFNQGVATQYSRDNVTFATRAFAVRPAR